MIDVMICNSATGTATPASHSYYNQSRLCFDKSLTHLMLTFMQGGNPISNDSLLWLLWEFEEGVAEPDNVRPW